MLRKALWVLLGGMGALLIVVTLAVPGAFFPYTPEIVGPDGEPLPESVAELTTLELGGTEQHILVRGANRANPILLWLHGGPGAAQMPLAHHTDGPLEETFVVVHWDQRGAGKSNHRGFGEGTMSLERYLADARELIRHLQERFDRDRIFLLGHSWGSQLGLELAARYPDDVHAYVGVSQVVDNHRAYAIGHRWLERRIREAEAGDDLRALEELGGPPYTEHAEHVAFAGLLGEYGGNLDWDLARLARVALRAPEYGLLDYGRWVDGANRGSGPMWDEVYRTGFSYLDRVPALDVPAFFLVGVRDYNTPAELVEEYCQELEAPWKGLVRFENSAHTPFLAEPDSFHAALIRIGESVLQDGRARGDDHRVAAGCYVDRRPWLGAGGRFECGLPPGAR